MNTSSQHSASKPDYVVSAYPVEIAEGLLKTMPNALQCAVMETLSAISILSDLLETPLAAHTELLKHLAQTSSKLPAALPPHMQEVLQSALRDLHATRQVLEKAWLGRAAEADGFWFDGEAYIERNQ
ncbi:hypothetical protein D16iCDA_02035 [Pseudomonas seleniipraecipitans]|uniref:Uncharacterized protein n=1 Tax=Phytopseudomonas seleniipraecipitans TaxID=640205 RepID=A0ABY5JCT8_9GAMM|nr:hypothetical protein [Pseudomonas seleniipraecipitans]UUD64508.1 hypothetical protein D16iCDA_02035 [Pseudomonas seleniipraecipitans]